MHDIWGTSLENHFMVEKPTYEKLARKVKRLEEDAFKRKQIEQALRESEERLALVLEAASEGIWDWDIKNGQTYASPRCSEIFGVKEDPGISPPSEGWASRIHPDDYDRVSRCMQDHLEGKAPFDVEYMHRHESGEYRWQRSRGMALFDENGDPYRMVGSIRDITESKRIEEEKTSLEAQIQQARQREALGTLAGGIAHDFNNLLTAILGNIDLSLMNAGDPEKVNRNLTKAKEACRRAKDLNRQVIVFARGGDPEKQTGPIVKCIQDSAMLALSGKGTKCEFSFPHDLWLVDFDPKQMKEVFANLITNASEAMPGKGVINVWAENIDPLENESSAFSDQKQIRISIQDQGKGIHQESLNKIFDPYFSSKESVTQKGLGLGLSICYSIIEKHEGRIEVQSEVGAGTIFHIYLPTCGDSKSGIESSPESD